MGHRPGVPFSGRSEEARTSPATAVPGRRARRKRVLTPEAGGRHRPSRRRDVLELTRQSRPRHQRKRRSEAPDGESGPRRVRRCNHFATQIKAGWRGPRRQRLRSILDRYVVLPATVAVISRRADLYARSRTSSNRTTCGRRRVHSLSPTPLPVATGNLRHFEPGVRASCRPVHGGPRPQGAHER
jgi:hypothetical protein